MVKEDKSKCSFATHVLLTVNVRNVMQARGTGVMNEEGMMNVMHVMHVMNVMHVLNVNVKNAMHVMKETNGQFKLVRTKLERKWPGRIHAMKEKKWKDAIE